MTFSFKPQDQYYGKTLISRDLLDEISEQHKRLLEDPFHDEALKTNEMQSLFNDSNVNSARLEADLMKGPLGEKAYSGHISKKDLEAEARKISARVVEAWILGCERFNGVLDEDLILSTGQILDPFLNEKGELRNIGGWLAEDISLIDSAKLRSRPGYEGYLDRFLREVNTNQVFYSRNDERSEPLSPVEKAIYSHFMIFYLQPNNDANKRTGRIIQNIILQDNQLPPPVLYSMDNKEYMEKIVNAYQSRRIREGNTLPNVLISRDEHEFFNYLGKKVLVSLQKVNDRLDSKKTFYVKINCFSKNPCNHFCAKGALTSLISKRDPSGFVRYNRERDYLIVRGNVCREDVEAVLDSLHNYVNYTINPRNPNIDK